MATRPATLTKKHFALLASALHEALKASAPSAAVDEDASDGVHRAAEYLAAALKSTNPAFDTERFLLAVTDGKHSRTPASRLYRLADPDEAAELQARAEAIAAGY
jgi:hypothetical protein